MSGRTRFDHLIKEVKHQFAIPRLKSRKIECLAEGLTVIINKE